MCCSSDFKALRPSKCQCGPVGLKHDGPDGTAYTDGTAGLVADGTDYKDVSAQ